VDYIRVAIDLAHCDQGLIGWLCQVLRKVSPPIFRAIQLRLPASILSIPKSHIRAPCEGRDQRGTGGKVRYSQGRAVLPTGLVITLKLSPAPMAFIPLMSASARRINQAQHRQTGFCLRIALVFAKLGRSHKAFYVPAQRCHRHSKPGTDHARLASAVGSRRER
jgi:hypothetical protein